MHYNFVTKIYCTKMIPIFLYNQGATQQQKDMIEQAAQVIAQDNTELASAFIQKTAVERAIPEMDKRLATVSVWSIFINYYCKKNVTFARLKAYFETEY